MTGTAATTNPLATAVQDAETATERPEAPYIVLTEAVTLRLDNLTGPNGEQLKNKAERVRRGEVVHLWPDDAQTTTLLDLLAIAPYVPGHEYPRPTIAQIAAAQGAVDSVAQRALRAGLGLEAAPNEPLGTVSGAASDSTTAYDGDDAGPYGNRSAFAADDDE